DLKQPKVVRQQITLRLDKELIDTLDAYCRYVDGSRDYVITEALWFVFKKDRGFSSQREAATGAKQEA
ncbi:MAG: hypothetical protein GY953_13440, partial [bacterium]|nr:hypothetical protein [bacterium]